MVRACDSAENQRCIEDIRGYFSHVTVLVLDPKVVVAGSPDWAAGRKVMMVLVGEDSATDGYRTALGAFLNDKSPGARYVHNVVIDRSHIVDKSVPHSTQVVTGLTELWFPDGNALEQAIKAGLLNVGLKLLQPAAAVVVEEHRIL